MTERQARPGAATPTRRQALLQTAGALAVFSCGSSVQAQAGYPAKPVHFVVGYPAGGAVDIVGRTVGQAMSTVLGQPVIVDNKPGAGSNIAIKSVIDSPADGYNLLVAANALAANMAQSVRMRTVLDFMVCLSLSCVVDWVNESAFSDRNARLACAPAPRQVAHCVGRVAWIARLPTGSGQALMTVRCIQRPRCRAGV